MASSSAAAPASLPRVPAYAWAWLQRSRPVLVEAARRLTGQPPTPGFVDALREQVRTDAFTRDVLLGVIAEVAFNGRVPSHRPAGMSWDRGLVWWAATLAGTTPAEFEARGPGPAQQRQLFAAEAAEPPPSPRPTLRPVGGVLLTQGTLAAALRDLLDRADGDQVPAEAIRALLADLERR